MNRFRPSPGNFAVRIVAAFLLFSLLAACSSAPYRPQAFDAAAMIERSVTQESDGIEVSAYAEQHPLDDINEILEASHHGKLQRRAVMVP